MTNNEVLIKVENVSTKFCRKLKRSLWYGMKDLGAELIGRSNSDKDIRKDEFWAVNDVSFEMRKAHRWILDHPKKKKTPGGMPAFLTIWMNSATNSGRGSSPPSREEIERRKRKSREMAKSDAEQRRRAAEASKRSKDTTPEPIGDLLDTQDGEG